jgi:hypothetical protein
MLRRSSSVFINCGAPSSSTLPFRAHGTAPYVVTRFSNAEHERCLGEAALPSSLATLDEPLLGELEDAERLVVAGATVTHASLHALDCLHVVRVHIQA